MVYSELEKDIWNRFNSHGSPIEIREFLRKGWTYHAKGIWLTLPGDNAPSVSFIGSPNFGYRSVDRDLEVLLLLYYIHMYLFYL